MNPENQLDEISYSTEEFGNHSLKAWRVAPGIYWIQTRLPAFARKLHSRQNSKLVVAGVAGGYLRTYEVPISRQAVRALVPRWLDSIRDVRLAPLNSPQVSKTGGSKPHSGNRLPQCHPERLLRQISQTPLSRFLFSKP